MEDNHKLALYVTYYLSRFNDEALANLDYITWNNAFDDIGDRLKVKRQSVQNWRDEFDPLFEHRLGWHQRPMIPSRVRVAQALENLDEIQIRGLVKDILSGKLKEDSEEESQLLSIVTEDRTNTSKKNYILRTHTGKAAEEFFMQHYIKTQYPINGELIDCRDLGCGYDYKINNSDGEHLVEVKGLSELSGGVLFTDKEWRTAFEMKKKYFLCIVSNLVEKPEIIFIQDPYQKLIPQKNIYPIIQISWGVSQAQLDQFLKGVNSDY